MTTLTVEWDGENIRRLTVAGHAGFAQSGRDIVCAAASVLITTCVNGLESVAGITPEVRQDEKAAVIAVSVSNMPDQGALRDAQVILRTICRGFEDIAEAYPKHMKIIDGRKSSC